MMRLLYLKWRTETARRTTSLQAEALNNDHDHDRKKRGKGIDTPKHGIAKARNKDHWGHVWHLYEEELDKKGH